MNSLQQLKFFFSQFYPLDPSEIDWLSHDVSNHFFCFSTEIGSKQLVNKMLLKMPKECNRFSEELAEFFDLAFIGSIKIFPSFVHNKGHVTWALFKIYLIFVWKCPACWCIYLMKFKLTFLFLLISKLIGHKCCRVSFRDSICRWAELHFCADCCFYFCFFMRRLQKQVVFCCVPLGYIYLLYQSISTLYLFL